MMIGAILSLLRHINDDKNALDHEKSTRQCWIFMIISFLHSSTFPRLIKEVILNTSMSCKMMQKATLPFFQCITNDDNARR